MIHVDTSVWIDHLRADITDLADLLRHGLVVVHPWTIGELSLGGIRNRSETLRYLSMLPAAPVALHHEVLAMMDSIGLVGRGIGYVDAHLLAAVLLCPGDRIWTGDGRLRAVARDVGVAAFADG